MGWLTLGKAFIKPYTKTGAKSVEKWKSKAAQAKLDSARFNLKQTQKQTDKVLTRLEKTLKKQKKILED